MASTPSARSGDTLLTRQEWLLLALTAVAAVQRTLDSRVGIAFGLALGEVSWRVGE